MLENTSFNTGSYPSQLKITDMRFVDIVGAPMDCTILRIDTNQGICGYGEIRDFSNKFYALQLKRLLIGENPCNINKIFRKIKQFGGHARQGGGVSGIEIALWDIAGKAYGVPVYQMLGGKSRDEIRIYCDTDVSGKHSGKDMGNALKERLSHGYNIVKMDLGIDLLMDVKDALCAPADYMRKLNDFGQQELSFGISGKSYAELMSIPHPFTGISITEVGLDYLEDYVRQVRDVIGYQVPLAIDHIGHVNYQSCIRLAKRLEKYNIFWMEDCVPWFYTEQWKRLSESTTIPMCTGEDIFSKEAFRPLIEEKAVSVLHPDVLTAGGISETMKIAEMAEDNGIAVAIHMAETPIGCMAAASVCAAMGNNLIAMEYHAHDVPWWKDIVKDSVKPVVENGHLAIADRPGLGIEELDDEVLKEHMNPRRPGLWKSTEEWDHEWSHDRNWS